MTKEERSNPDLINPSRKKRIAKGAGVDIAEVNRIVKQFEQMKKVWFDDSWDEFSVALSDVVKQEENDKLRRLIDDLDDSAD